MLKSEPKQVKLLKETPKDKINKKYFTSNTHEGQENYPQEI